MILLELDVLPVPWAASRVSGKKHYNPRGKQKDWHRWLVSSKYRNNILVDFVVLDFLFIFPLPASANKSERQKMLEGEIIPTACDCTNLQKFEEDCLKKIVISDDRNVAKITSEKIYGVKEKIIIKIWTLQEYRKLQNENGIRGN